LKVDLNSCVRPYSVDGALRIVTINLEMFSVKALFGLVR
jgi:hypothetical protein